MAEEIKQSERIQTSILNGVERKVLVRLARLMPRWVTSDMLTWFGVFGAFLGGLGYVLANVLHEVNWIWLSSLGLFINWFGDSLDGTIARVRNRQRKLYGYYLDHNIDCVCEFFLFVGFGLSGMLHFWMPLLAYIFYLQLEVYVAINAKIKNEFKLTYGGFGPTELRVIIIILNIFLMYVPAFHQPATMYNLLGKEVEMFMLDWVGAVITVILMITYLTSFFKDLKYFDRIDPLIKK